MSGSIRLRAYAKINLFLRVGPSRKDGYHNLLTLFQSISLCDTLHIKLRMGKPGGIRIFVNDPKIPVGRKNTIHRAYQFLRGQYPAARRASFDVRLTKRIPAGTGLGGASADAAAFLIGACRLMVVPSPTSRRDLGRIAKEVGSDVPFCLQGGTAIGRGRGERLDAIPPLSGRKLFLIIPTTRVSTRQAYRLLDKHRPAKNLTKHLSIRSLEQVVEGIRSKTKIVRALNDFEAEVCRIHSELRRISGLVRQFGLAAMTGSGSAFFVLPSRMSRLRDLRAALPNTPMMEATFVGRGVAAG